MPPGKLPPPRPPIVAAKPPAPGAGSLRPVGFPAPSCVVQRKAMPPPPVAKPPGAPHPPAPTRILQRAQDDKPPGKTYASWEDYHKKRAAWLIKHNARVNAVRPAGGYLYHCTQAINLPPIARDGLMPKKPEWGTPDASKDGILSMATAIGGAGAMGGKSVMLRASWDELAALGIRFKIVKGTEVRTTSPIPAANLRKRKVVDGVPTWVPLSEA